MVPNVYMGSITESLLSRLKSISCDKNKSGFAGIKSAIIWGNTERGTYPLLYIKKPKHLSQEDFDEILSNLEVTLYKNGKGSFN